MSPAFSTWLPLLLLLLILPLIFLSRRKSHPKLPPGPPQLPIIGSIGVLGNISHRTLCQLSEKYGPLVHLKLGSLPAVVVSSSKLARNVIKTQNLDFCHRPHFVYYKKFSYNFVGISTTPYGDYHRDIRKVCNNELLGLKKVQSFGFVREEEVARLIASVSRCASSSKPANLTELMFDLTSTVISRAAFGKSGRGGDVKTNFHGVLEEAQAWSAAFFFADYFPWLGWIDFLTGQRARMEKSFRNMDAFHDQVIEEHLDPRREKGVVEDLVDVLIRVQKDLNLTRDHIKAILMVIPSII